MQAGDSKSYDDINVTPMVDLYLVLLLIFIIMTTAGVQGMRATLPKAASKPSATKAPPLQAVFVDNQGNLFLQGKPVTLVSLKSQLEALMAKTPEFPVVVKGDSQTQYQMVMSVLDVLGQLNIKQINLATKPPK